jgi:hypothetical protein
VHQISEKYQQYTKEIIESRKEMQLKDHIAQMQQPVARMEFDLLRKYQPAGSPHIPSLPSVHLPSLSSISLPSLPIVLSLPFTYLHSPSLTIDIFYADSSLREIVGKIRNALEEYKKSRPIFITISAYDAVENEGFFFFFLLFFPFFFEFFFCDNVIDNVLSSSFFYISLKLKREKRILKLKLVFPFLMKYWK